MLVCFCGTVFVTLLSVVHSEQCSPVLGQVFSLPTTLSTCDCCHLWLNHVYDNLGLNSFVFISLICSWEGLATFIGVVGLVSSSF